MTNTDALADLVRSWLSLKIRLIDETSSDTKAAYPGAIEQAKAHAEAVGLTWSNKLVPEFVQDKLDYNGLARYVLHIPEPGIWYDRSLPTASWWDKYELQPGDYPIEWVTIDHLPVPDGQRPYYARIVVDAVLVESYRVSRLLAEHLAKHETHHEKTTVTFHPYAYQITDTGWHLMGDQQLLGVVHTTY